MEDYSLFSWADKGQWETVQTPGRYVSRDGDWFRIGFEPIFVDFTKRGSWFIVISLLSVSCACTICPQSSLAKPAWVLPTSNSSLLEHYDTWKTLVFR